MSAPMFSGALRALSNYADTPFYFPEMRMEVASGEHAFNALKTLDPGARADILAAPTPGAAKKLGRSVQLRAGWDAGVRVWSMTRVVQAKFSDPDLARLLIDTGDLELRETNTWHDQFWGDCLCRRHENSPGVNMLGELLMTKRAALSLSCSPI